jgi:thioredoxin 1
VIGLVVVKHASKWAARSEPAAAAEQLSGKAQPGPSTTAQAAPAEAPRPSAAAHLAPAPSGAAAVTPKTAGSQAVATPSAQPPKPAAAPIPAPAEIAELRKPAEPLPGSKFADSLESGRPTMADFGAGWCQACKLMEPVLKIAAVKYEGKVNILFVDTDEYGPLAKQHRIAAIPTQIFFDAKGKEVGRHVGYYPIEELEAQLKSLGLIK